MRVLFLTTRLPFPPRRGDQVRAWHLLKGMASRHDVTCVAVTRGSPAASDVDRVRALGIAVEVIHQSRIGDLSAVARGISDRRPFQVLLHDRRRAQRTVSGIADGGEFDLVHAQMVRSVDLVPPDLPLVVDLIDAMSLNMSRRGARGRGPLAAVARREARRLVAFEAEAVGRADESIVVAPGDREALGSGVISVIPNGVDLDDLPYREEDRDSELVVFGGALSYFPNVDAAVNLAREVFPLIRSRIPGSRLRLVGARPSRTVRKLAQLPGVSVAANVPSMVPEVGSAAVTVIPMRAGTGMQNKVLEAMALGTPVVTTPTVAAAIGAEDRDTVLVGDSASALAQEAVSLMLDRHQAVELARRARDFVSLRYRWDTAVDAVDAVWRRVAGAQSSSSGSA